MITMMAESWRSRRVMLLLLGCIIILVISAFFIFGYRLEKVYNGDFVLKKFVAWNNLRNTLNRSNIVTKQASFNQTTEKEPDYTCYKNEPVVIVESCVACSEFERNALKAAYCQESGYYDKLNCTRSKRIGLKACHDHTNQSLHFNLFTLFCSVLSVSSFGIVNWRQKVLNRRSYMRIRNQIDP